MINRIEFANIRGRSGELTLGTHTLLVGPNGSGKTTIAIAAQLALLGYIPGHDKDDVFVNASGDNMSATVVATKDGKAHKIERVWKKKGDSVTMQLTVDGVKAGRQSANALIQLALGDANPVFDLPALWQQSSSQQRRTIMSMAMDGDADALIKEEADARDRKNARATDRRGTEAAMSQLAAELASVVRPAGNLASIQRDLQKTQEDLSAVQKRVADGEANDKARANMLSLIESLPADRAELDETEKALATATEKAAHAAIILDECRKGEPKRLEASRGSKANNVRLRLLHEDMLAVAAEDETTEKLKDTIAGWAAIIDRAVPSEEAIASAERKWAVWDARIKNAMTDNDKLNGEASRLVATHDRLKQKIEAAESARSAMQKIGPSVSEEDRAIGIGLALRIADLRKVVTVLSKIEGLERALASAELKAQHAAKAEDDAKKACADIQAKQAALIVSTNQRLADASHDVLPDGELFLTDDGKELRLSWKRGDGRIIDRHSLSGGEKTIFDAAIGYALAPNALIIVEAAEVDTWGIGVGVGTLCRVLSHLFLNGNAQFLLLTCHDVGVTVSDWTTHRMVEQTETKED